MDGQKIADIADAIGVNADDVTVEVRSGGRSTIVYYESGNRQVLGEVADVDDLEPFLAGLRAGVERSGARSPRRRIASA